ncbi:hypothetical protein C8Q75DRAFT_75678 [Abortiporus biennis]|nr:hypothetical protein C8Q75DRAFT_75678 [Abortiporus biennis]
MPAKLPLKNDQQLGQDSLKRRKARQTYHPRPKGLPTTLGDLISTSTQLQLLQLHSSEEIDTFHIFRTTKAPLADLNFSFYQHAKGYSLPVKLLEPFSETLVTLVVDCDVILSTEIKLPNVHSLELPIMRYGLSLQTLIEIFPSIQTLHLYIPEIMPLARMTQMRERNRAVDCSMWSNLFAVTGLLDALFSIGVSSSTFHLAIDGIALSDADMVGAILRDTTPRHLALSFDDMPAHCDLQNAELESFVSKEVAEKLEVVILDIPLRVELSDENPLSLLNMHRLVKILKPPYLILNIVVHIHDDLTPTPSSPYNNYLLPKNFFDIHSIALEMSEEKSSLRYIRITTTLLCDSYNFSSETLENFWHVCPDSTLTELPMKLARGLENPKLAAAAMERLYLYQVKFKSSLQETAV